MKFKKDKLILLLSIIILIAPHVLLSGQNIEAEMILNKHGVFSLMVNVQENIENISYAEISGHYDQTGELTISASEKTPYKLYNKTQSALVITKNNNILNGTVKEIVEKHEFSFSRITKYIIGPINDSLIIKSLRTNISASSREVILYWNITLSLLVLELTGGKHVIRYIEKNNTYTLYFEVKNSKIKLTKDNSNLLNEILFTKYNLISIIRSLDTLKSITITINVEGSSIYLFLDYKIKGLAFIEKNGLGMIPYMILFNRTGVLSIKYVPICAMNNVVILLANWNTTISNGIARTQIVAKGYGLRTSSYDEVLSAIYSFYKVSTNYTSARVVGDDIVFKMNDETLKSFDVKEIKYVDEISYVPLTTTSPGRSPMGENYVYYIVVGIIGVIVVIFMSGSRLKRVFYRRSS